MAAKRRRFYVSDKKGQVVERGIISTKSTLKGPGGVEIEPEFEKPIVSVTVNNPFRKILYWLDQIRKHQTTTLAFKLSIPLIALPVLVFAVFQIGRSYGISFQKSQAVASPAPSAAALNSAQSVEISRAGTLKVAKGQVQTRYLLQLRNGEIIALEIPENINLAKYANKQVLVTGLQNKTTGVIKVADIAEIEVLNTTVVVESSPSPSPFRSTPSATP